METRMITCWVVLLISSSAIVNSICPPSTSSPIVLSDFVKHLEKNYIPRVANSLFRSTTCTWTIYANHYNRIAYQLTDLRMDASDTLEVYDGKTLIEKVMNTSLSNNTRLLGVTTSSSLIVKITYPPGHRTTELYFNLHAISAVHKSGIENPQAGGTAKLTASTQKKFLTSPWFPNRYPSYVEWTWTITGVGSQYINFTIIFLDMNTRKDSSGNCIYDELTIIADGVTQTICPDKSWATRTTMSNGDQMEVWLTSLSSPPAHGFVASYIATKLWIATFCCSGYLTIYSDIGGPCNNTVECKDDNAVCADSTCQCKSGYFKDDVCKVQRNFGGSCISDDACKNRNAVCTDNICKCKSGYFQNGMVCEVLAEKSLGKSCNSDDECKQPNTVCTKNTCKCKSGYVQNGEACEAPCYGNPNMLFCPENKICYCKPGMFKTYGECKGFSGCIQSHKRCTSSANWWITECKKKCENTNRIYKKDCNLRCSNGYRSICSKRKRACQMKVFDAIKSCNVRCSSTFQFQCSDSLWTCYMNVIKASLPEKKSFWYYDGLYRSVVSPYMDFCIASDCPSLTKYCCSRKYENCKNVRRH